MNVWQAARLYIVVAMSVFAVGCRSDSATHDVVTDSAGVKIVGVDWDHAPLQHVQSDPDLVIGGQGGAVELELYRIGSVGMLRPGVLLLTEVSTQQVIRIDLPAMNVSRFGRSGDGPLEFRGISQPLLNSSGDLFVFDTRRRRLVEVTEYGELLRELRAPDVGGPGTSLLLVAAGPIQLETLYLAVLPGFSSEASGRPYRGQGALVRFISPADTLTMFRGAATFTSSTSTGGVMFGAATLIAGTEQGVWLGDTADQSVALWTPERGLTKIVRWTTRMPRVLTGARVAQFWSRLESGRTPDQREALAEMKKILPFADSIPAFGSLVASPGAVWIGSYQPPETQLLGDRPTALTWLVVDYRTGGARRIVTPAGFTLRYAADDYILGVYRDSLDVETIRRYRLASPQ